MEIRAIRWCRLAVCAKTHPALAPGLWWRVKSKSSRTAGWTARTVLSSSGASNAPITQRQECCYFKAKLFLSVFVHTIRSWVNLPRVAYPPKPRWCFMRVFYSGNFRVTGVWLSWSFFFFFVETYSVRLKDHRPDVASVLSVISRCTPQ